MSHYLLIKNAKQVLTMSGQGNADLGIIENGWIFVQDGIIKLVGRKEIVSRLMDVTESQCTVLDATNKVVMPGFIDCHTHVQFGGSRVDEYNVKVIDPTPEALERRGIKTGIYASVEMTTSCTQEEIEKQTVRRMENMVLHGTTTLESKSGYALTVEGELAMLRLNQKLNQIMPIDIISTYLVHGWQADMSKEDYIRTIKEKLIPVVGREKLAVFGDIWCDDGHFTKQECRDVLKCCKEHGMMPRIHTDAYSDVGGTALAIDMKMPSADHLNFTPTHLFSEMAKEGVTGVLMPALDFAVAHPKPFLARKMLDTGMTVALATNCCPGCWCEDMQFVIILAARLYGMSSEEALMAATYGGASALGMHDRGVLMPGYRADIQMMNIENYQDIIYKYGKNNVETVVKDGKIIVDQGKIL